jgi:hypothetical protein
MIQTSFYLEQSKLVLAHWPPWLHSWNPLHLFASNYSWTAPIPLINNFIIKRTVKLFEESLESNYIFLKCNVFYSEINIFRYQKYPSIIRVLCLLSAQFRQTSPAKNIKFNTPLARHSNVHIRITNWSSCKIMVTAELIWIL